MRKALPVVIFTILLAGCHGGGSAPATITKTITVPAAKTTVQSSSRSTTTSLAAPIAEAPQQVIVQQTPQIIYEPVPVPMIYNPEPESADSDVPLGFTGAPTEPPQPLWDKSISYCMDDPVYERGTTMFTDGTTGWTSYCAG